MIDYSKLPTEILTIIFEYLDADIAIPLSKKDILQCQLTCKSWAVVAKTNLYQKIGVQYNNHAAILFFNSLIKQNLGYLVKNMTIYGTKTKRLTQNDMSQFISQIGNRCPNLKNISIKYYCFAEVEFWKCIRTQRSKGAFSKLQVATIPKCSGETQVKQYYKAAYSLKDSLIELRILHHLPIEKLESFKNIRTIYFSIKNRNEIYELDQHIKLCPSVKCIDIQLIDGSNAETRMNDLNTSSFNVFPQVKQLFFKSNKFDNELFGYVMNVFPNLNELNVYFKIKSVVGSSNNKISNQVASRFLSYLMNIPSASVNIFPVEDVDDLLMNFQDISDMNRSLNITYRNKPKFQNCLILSRKQGINIDVYSPNSNHLQLPRIGMIEKSGKRLQSVTLNLGMNYNCMTILKEPNALNNGIDVYPIFLHCTNLESIHILCTSLFFLGMHAQQEERLSLQSIILENCFISDRFFSRLSYLTEYINTLTIRDMDLCKEKKLHHTNKYIDMPDTKLNTIHYHLPYSVNQIFLKLKTKRGNHVDWFFASYHNYFQRCSKEKYEASLRDQDSFSLFIHCKHIFTIECGVKGKSIIFKNKK